MRCILVIVLYFASSGYQIVRATLALCCQQNSVGYSFPIDTHVFSDQFVTMLFFSVVSKTLYKVSQN